MKRISILTLFSLILLACEQGNAPAPGGLPAPGSFTSNVPGGSTTEPCVNGVGNCATVPAPVPGPTPPKISFPDLKSDALYTAVGNAATTLVQTDYTDSISSSCTPAITHLVGPYPNNPHIHVFYVGSMPNQELSCSLTATGPGGNTTATLILKPSAASGASTIPVIKGVPDSFAIKEGSTGSIENISISNLQEKSTVSLTCQKNKKTSVTKTAAGTYTASITQNLAWEQFDMCTILAINPNGELASVVIGVKTLPKDFTIVPLNFKLGEPLLMKNASNINVFEAYTDNTYKTKPQFKIEGSVGVAILSVKLSCPGNTFFENESQPFFTGTAWQMNIQYMFMPATGAGTMMTCTLKVTPNDNEIPPVEFQFPILKW